MNKAAPALLILVATVLSCDNGKKPPGKPPAAVTLKGHRMEVTLVATEKERRGGPARFLSVTRERAYLMAWPRPRFMKLESENAHTSFDVAFLDPSGRVVDQRSLTAGDPEGIMPQQKAAYALFTLPGLLSKLGVQNGDTADFSPGITEAQPEELPVVRFGDATVHVELALTTAAHRHGLMFRPRMSDDDGMLFAYPSEEPHSFWMGNTLIPLDIAFLKSDGTLINVCEMKTYPDPRNPPTFYETADSAEPARFILETNLGWFKRKGIKPGDKAILPREALDVGR